MQIFRFLEKKNSRFWESLTKKKKVFFSAIFREFFVIFGNLDEIHVLGRKMWMAIFVDVLTVVSSFFLFFVQRRRRRSRRSWRRDAEP